MKGTDRYECPAARLYEMDADESICAGSSWDDTQTVGEIEYDEGWII